MSKTDKYYTAKERIKLLSELKRNLYRAHNYGSYTRDLDKKPEKISGT